MLTAVCLAVALLCGCGDSDEDQIREVMAELRDAQESGDAEKACEEVYVVREPGREEEGEGEEEGEKEGGFGNCERAFEQAVEARRAGVKRLRTRLVRVEVDGDEGEAVLHTAATRADDSTFERDVPYELVRTEEGWRVRISPEG
jgi:hypothetical protein